MKSSLVNQGPDLSPRKVTLNGFDTYWFDNEWCLVTAATQLKGILQSGRYCKHNGEDLW